MKENLVITKSFVMQPLQNPPLCSIAEPSNHNRNILHALCHIYDIEDVCTISQLQVQLHKFLTSYSNIIREVFAYNLTFLVH
jgi:hypothetical protein